MDGSTRTVLAVVELNFPLGSSSPKKLKGADEVLKLSKIHDNVRENAPVWPPVITTRKVEKITENN
jgi:hypothetical protein